MEKTKKQLWYLKNREKCIKSNIEYVKKNRDRINLKRRQARASRDITQIELDKEKRKKYPSYKNRKRIYVYNPSIYLKRKQKDVELKRMVLNYYGHNCECCGESNFSLLTIDHIDNNGKEHKNSKGIKLKGRDLYLFIIKNKFPSGLRILCFNCNIGRQFNKGICPHKNPVY
jgi:hypothetical protein